MNVGLPWMSSSAFLLTKVQEYPTRPGLKVKWDPTASVTASVRGWLDVARRHGKEGSVAHHLIGAMLQLRFPELAIGMGPASTSDQQLGREGDFRMGDTVFHVTVAPMRPVYDKCKRNLQSRATCLSTGNAKASHHCRSNGRDERSW